MINYIHNYTYIIDKNWQVDTESINGQQVCIAPHHPIESHHGKSPSNPTLKLLPKAFQPFKNTMIEGSLEVKLPTIWRDKKQSREEAERRERLEERRSEEKE